MVYHSDIDGSALEDEWLTVLSHEDMWRKIVCKGSQYESKVSHCGDWGCLDCADLVRRDWISHLVNVTKGQALYMVQADVRALPAKMNAICEAKADYVQIRTWRDWQRLMVIMNKPISKATQIPENNLREVLESAIPGLYDYPAMFPPRYNYISIFASTAWKMVLDPEDPTARLVLRTTRPVFFQKEVAIALGAEPCGPSKWRSPADVNQVKWESRFVQGLRECEKGIGKPGMDPWALDDYCDFLYGYYHES